MKSKFFWENLRSGPVFKKKYKKPIGNSYPIVFFLLSRCVYMYVFMKKKHLNTMASIILHIWRHEIYTTLVRNFTIFFPDMKSIFIYYQQKTIFKT